VYGLVQSVSFSIVMYRPIARKRVDKKFSLDVDSWKLNCSMKAYRGIEVKIHIFLTSAVTAGDWSASRPCRFTPGERAPGTHWIGGWVDTRAGLDDVEKRKFLILPGLEFRPCES
jgi:hypothetical protein